MRITDPVKFRKKRSQSDEQKKRFSIRKSGNAGHKSQPPHDDANPSPPFTHCGSEQLDVPVYRIIPN